MPAFKKAFTLIELLVVVAIMALLVGAIVFSTNNTREKGRDAKRKEELKTLSNALVAYYADNGTFPVLAGSSPLKLDYSSDEGTSWIPELDPYLPKLPKDPRIADTVGKYLLAVKTTFNKVIDFEAPKYNPPPKVKTQVAGHNSSHIVGRIQDPDDDMVRFTNEGQVEKEKKGLKIGRKNSCDEPTEVALRFTLNQGLIKNKHIDSAKINFNPKVDTTEDAAINATDPLFWGSNNIRTTFKVEKTFDPGKITDNNDWANRKNNTTKASKDWNNIGAWSPIPTDDNETISADLRDLIQELVDSYPPGTSFHIIAFWENKIPPGQCIGRVPKSKEDDDPNAPNNPGDPVDDPPVLEITVSDPVPPTCSPTTHSQIYVGETATFYANGGNGTYSWNSSGGTVIGGSGTTPTLQISYPSAGVKTVSVTSNAQTSSTCTVTIIDPSTVPGYSPGTGTSNNTACNGKSYVYCYRVSLDKKHFILWAQLENRNDPEIYQFTATGEQEWGPSAICQADDQKPLDSTLNYCLSSPN